MGKFLSTIMTSIPDQLRANSLSTILDGIRNDYVRMIRQGRIFGLMITDQDAKVLAVDSFFDSKINYWDIGAIGAALYGVSKQGKDFFNADELDRASLVYKNTQFFVERIGTIAMTNAQERELIMIVIGNEKIVMGFIMNQMKTNAPKIKKQVEADETTQHTMKMSEDEFMKQIKQLKTELFAMGK